MNMFVKICLFSTMCFAAERASPVACQFGSRVHSWSRYIPEGKSHTHKNKVLKDTDHHNV